MHLHASVWFAIYQGQCWLGGTDASRWKLQLLITWILGLRIINLSERKQDILLSSWTQSSHGFEGILITLGNSLEFLGFRHISNIFSPCEKRKYRKIFYCFQSHFFISIGLTYIWTGGCLLAAVLRTTGHWLSLGRWVVPVFSSTVIQLLSSDLS